MRFRLDLRPWPTTLRRLLKRAALAVGLGLAVASASPGASGSQATELDRLMASAPAPGVEALLLAHVNDGRVGRRWRELLRHDDADVRLSAARGLGSARVRTAASDLLQALAREQDVDGLAELLQSIAIVASDADVPQIYPHLDRIPFGRAGAIVDGLAAARPALVARHLTTEAPLRRNAEGVRVAYARIAGSAPAEIARVDATLDFTGDDDMTAGAVRGAAAARHRLPISVVQAGLRRDAVDRLATVAYLAAVYRSPAAVPPDAALREAARAGASAAGDEPADRWVDALVARWLGADAPGDLEAIVLALPDASWIRGASRQAMAVMSVVERQAFVRRFSLSAPSARAVLDARPDDPATPPAVLAEPVTVLTDLPGAMLAGVIQLTGCKPAAGDERFVAVRYHPDRRPASVGLGAEPFSPGCDRAARAVAAMAYGAPPVTTEGRGAALLRLDPEFVACLSDVPPATAAPPALHDTGLRLPEKTRDLTPEYPAVAVRSRLQGVVGLDARIERSGCVSEIRVIRPVHAYLDMAAVRAVSHWRYTPATLNGEVVPVFMTVDTTFSLR